MAGALQRFKADFFKAVSYTHLDVYKRQGIYLSDNPSTCQPLLHQMSGPKLGQAQRAASSYRASTCGFARYSGVAARSAVIAVRIE